MKLRTIALAGVAAVALSSTSAFADTTGWYLGLGVGYDHLNPTHMTSTFPFSINVDSQASVIVVGSVGYKFDSGLRLEDEIGYDTHDVSKTSGLTGSQDIKSDLINLIYDMPLSDQWSLSLGGGVGAGNVGEHLKEIAVPGFAFTRGSHVEFEWQAIAGLNYQLSDDLQLFADYRFRSAEADHD